MLRYAGLLFIYLVAQGNALAKQPRNGAARHAFAQSVPCPSTGQNRLPCPGHIIDHVIPLCAGGPDLPSNMQWQTVDAAKAKDRVERDQCRAAKTKP